MAPIPSKIMALEPSEHPGAAIVIDVIRAFTTAAAAFEATRRAYEDFPNLLIWQATKPS